MRSAPFSVQIDCKTPKMPGTYRASFFVIGHDIRKLASFALKLCPKINGKIRP